MGSKAERGKIEESSSAIIRHSINQKNLKRTRDRAEKGFRNRDRVMRGLSRQERQDQFLEEVEEKKRLEEECDRGSLHALRHNISKGVLAQGDVDYILRHEETVDRFETEKDSITITFVYLTPPNSKNLS